MRIHTVGQEDDVEKRGLEAVVELEYMTLKGKRGRMDEYRRQVEIEEVEAAL